VFSPFRRHLIEGSVTGLGLCMNGTFLRAITWRGDTCGWKGRSRLEVLEEPSKKWTNDVGDVLMRTRQTIMDSTGHPRNSFLSSSTH